MHDLIKITPDTERAKSLMRQVSVRLDAVRLLSQERHISLIVKAYYEMIKELLTALACVQGYKALSHVSLLEYFKQRKILSAKIIFAIDQLRKIRNDIAYEGYAVPKEYHDRAVPEAKIIITLLSSMLQKKAFLSTVCRIHTPLS
jgi:hypothetical protein